MPLNLRLEGKIAIAIRGGKPDLRTQSGMGRRAGALRLSGPFLRTFQT